MRLEPSVHVKNKHNQDKYAQLFDKKHNPAHGNGQALQNSRTEMDGSESEGLRTTGSL